MDAATRPHTLVLVPVLFRAVNPYNTEQTSFSYRELNNQNFKTTRIELEQQIFPTWSSQHSIPWCSSMAHHVSLSPAPLPSFETRYITPPQNLTSSFTPQKEDIWKLQCVTEDQDWKRRIRSHRDLATTLHGVSFSIAFQHWELASRYRGSIPGGLVFRMGGESQ